MSALRLLDLFSGVGGFSLGLESSGAFETAAFCEIDRECRRTLAHRWPGVKIYDDVRTLDADALRRDGLRFDAICGGFPCQDLSLAGKGAGLDGERSGLWREYARLVRELRPRVVIVENVAALLGRGMGVVLGCLADCGYDAVWRRLAAADVGAPHLRQRIWIVAYAADVHDDGFGDALWRALAEEFPGAAADADCESSGQPIKLSWRPDAAELADDGGACALADAFGEPRQPCWIGDANEGQGGRHACGGGGRALVPDAGLARLPSSERAALCRARWRDEGRATSECDRRPAQPGLGRMADGLSDRLDAHPGWAEEPPIPRVARDVPRRVARLTALGNAVVPEIPRRIGRAILRAATAEAQEVA